jgi:hypothetical protein
MSAQAFSATLAESTVGSGGHWVVVPDDVMAALTSKGRVKVRATFNGIPYRGSIVKYSGRYVLGVTNAIAKRLDLSAGDVLEVVVEADMDERTVELPPELAQAFAGNPNLNAAWDKLSYTARREKARSIAEAKKPETRVRRLEAVLRELAG